MTEFNDADSMPACKVALIDLSASNGRPVPPIGQPSIGTPPAPREKPIATILQDLAAETRKAGLTTMFIPEERLGQLQKPVGSEGVAEDRGDDTSGDG